MSQPTHIVHVIFSLENGGAENMLVDIVNEQVAYARVTLIIAKDLIDKPLLQSIDQQATVMLLNRDPKNYSIAGLFLKLQSSIARLKPEIVHIHQETMISFFPKWIRTKPYKLFLTVHDTGIRIPRSVFNVDTIFAISKSVATDLQQRQKLASRLNYNGVCVGNIVRKENYALGERFKVVQISRLLHTKKGQHILLEAAAGLIKQHGLPLEIDLIGDGPSHSFLQDLVRQLKIETSVNFLGSIPKREVYKKLHQYDLLVQPSLYEGFGLTVVESMIAGVPVLVSDIEGPLEIIQDGEYGFAFKGGNSESCAEQIHEIIKQYRLGSVEAIAAKASQHARKNFDIRRTACDYAKLEDSKTAAKVHTAWR